MTSRQREILLALRRDGHLTRGDTGRTYRLLMPRDPWYAGRVVQAGTIARMREAGLLDGQLRPTPEALARATRIR